MLSSEIVYSIRCPIGKAALVQKDGFLACTLCNVKFPVREGIPVLLIDEAILPEGIKDTKELTCLRQAEMQTKGLT